MRVDPTECGAVGEWTFDPADGRHAGWEREFSIFMRANEKRLLCYVRHLADGFSQAELDPEHVTQVAWARAAFRWPHVQAIERQKPGKAMAYLYVVARNLVMRAYANRRELSKIAARQPGWTSAGQQARPVADQAVGSVDLVCRPEWEDELLDRLSPGPAMRAIQDLPGHQRAATYLAEVEGLKAKEIGQVLGVSPADVRTYTKRGRDNVRKALVGAGYAASALIGLVVAGSEILLYLRDIMYFLLYAMLNPVALFIVADIAIAVTALALAKISKTAGPWSVRGRWAASLTRLAGRLPVGRMLLRRHSPIDPMSEVP